MKKNNKNKKHIPSIKEKNLFWAAVMVSVIVGIISGLFSGFAVKLINFSLWNNFFIFIFLGIVIVVALWLIATKLITKVT